MLNFLGSGRFMASAQSLSAAASQSVQSYMMLQPNEQELVRDLASELGNAVVSPLLASTSPLMNSINGAGLATRRVNFTNAEEISQKPIVWLDREIERIEKDEPTFSQRPDLLDMETPGYVGREVQALWNSILSNWDRQFKEDDFVCPICRDVVYVAVVTPCRHYFCRGCLGRALTQQSICPLCRRGIDLAGMKLLSDAATVDGASHKYFSLYVALPIECPDCQWRGLMGSWAPHAGSTACIVAGKKRRDRGEFDQLQVIPRQQRRKQSNQSASSPLNRKLKGSTRPGQLKSALTTASWQGGDSDDDEIAHRGGGSRQINLRHGGVSTRLPRSPKSNRGGLEMLRRPSDCEENQPSSAIVGYRGQSRTDVSPAEIFFGVVPSDMMASTNGSRQLISWLTNNPCRIVSFYVVHHHMESQAGAIAGHYLKVVQHWEGLMELRPAPLDIDLLSDSSEDANLEAVLARQLLKKYYLSTELFYDKEGIQWSVYDHFPRLKSTATEIEVYRDLNVSSDTYVQFLIRVRDRKYSLANWNCQTLVHQFKEFVKIRETPDKRESVPRPHSCNADLDIWLEHVISSGDLPRRTGVQTSTARKLEPSTADAGALVVGSAETEQARGNLFSRFVHRLRRRDSFDRGASARDDVATMRARMQQNPPSAVDSTARGSLRVFVSQVFVILFPPEDKVRMHLRNLPFSRQGASSSTITSTNAGNEPNDDGNINAMSYHLMRDLEEKLAEPKQRNLRFVTFPVVLFHVKTSSNGRSAKGLCYLSLEFRSDVGLWWHVYLNFPSSNSPELTLSAQTSFELAQLRQYLQSVAFREYDSLQWAGWDLTIGLLSQCCPDQAAHLLYFPIADDFEDNFAERFL